MPYKRAFKVFLGATMGVILAVIRFCSGGFFTERETSQAPESLFENS